MTRITSIGRHRSYAFGYVLLTLFAASIEGSLPASSSTPASRQDNNDVAGNNHNHFNTSAVPASADGSLMDLSHKNLSTLGLLRAARTSQVQLLNLSANHLSHIATDTFAKVNLSALRCLDLAANDVTVIQSKAFGNLTTLQHLNLSGNSLTTLADDTFKGLDSLQQLDLSHNNLSSIAPGALELSSLARLALTGNARLGSVSLFIATGRRLQTIDAMAIALINVPSALTHSIRTLHLAQNAITIVARGDMDTYPLLQLLDLTSNQLVQIEDDALGRLEMLTILYLTNNRLIEMPHSLPEHLRVLHLEHNDIATLRPADLGGLTQLEVLLLNGNHIQSIAPAAFVTVPNLVTLDLSQNPLCSLPAGALTGPSKLRVLRLARLNVSTPHAEAAFPILETEFLITLDLSGSPGMARQWFGDTAALAAARELQVLDVSGCAIETVPRDTLHYLPQLRSLHLRANALNCSGLEWLAEWMRVQEVGEHRDVYCQSPGELWGTPLVDLQCLPGANIDEKHPTTSTTTTQTPTTAAARRRSNEHVLDTESVKAIFNPIVMNILRGQNEILDATISPKAIKTVTGTSTSPPGNLFMKNAPPPSDPPEYANDHKPAARKDTRSNAIKSLSLIETNGTAGHSGASMYLLGGKHQPHPGMYLLIIGIMGATLILITLTSRMSRANRDDLQILRAYQPDRHHDGELIEVSSLPTVSELW